jgi:hypothetical protein
MIEIRRAVTDADLEAWIRIRRALVPDESGGTVAKLRAQEQPERLLLLADVDGALAGSGFVDRSDLPDRFGVTWTQRGNEGMRRLNEALGYEYRDVSATMVAPLPLPL